MAVLLTFATMSGLATASSVSVAQPVMPLVLPGAPTSCQGVPTGDEWSAGRPTVVLAGAACPAAAVWLRPTGAVGAGAGDGSAGLVDWIRDPSNHRFAMPAWAPLLPGKPHARLADVNGVLNDAWAGKVINLALFDSTRGVGDHQDARLVAVLPFQLTKAYLDQPDPACGASGRLTCLVGTFLDSAPSSSPSLQDCASPGHAGRPETAASTPVGSPPRASPTHGPHRTPVPPATSDSGDAGASGSAAASGTPDDPPPSAGGSDGPSSASSPAGSGSPASPAPTASRPRASTRPVPPRPSHPPPPSHRPCPSASPSPPPSASASASASTSASPSSSASPTTSPSSSPSASSGPSPSASSSPPPSPTPSPASYLEISVAAASTIQLTRGQVNGAVLSVQVASDGAWHLTTAAAGTGASRGYMRLDGTSTVTLTAPMQVATSSGQRVDLTAPTPIRIASGSGSLDVPVVVDQSVGAADAPGTYSIELIVSAISGF